MRFLLVISLFLALCQGMPMDKKEKEDDKKDVSGGVENNVNWITKETKDEHSLDKCEKDEDCRYVSGML